MAKKKGRSEKKTDWLGRSYIQHYDSKGNKSGRSERKETFFGGKYTQHYDPKGEKKTNRTQASPSAKPGTSHERRVQSYSNSGNSYPRAVTTVGPANTGYISPNPQDYNPRVAASPSRSVIAVILTAVAIFGIVILVSRKPANPPNVGSVVNSASTFRGTVNKKYKVEMNLRRQGNNLSGSYVYLKYNIPIELRGTIDDANNLVIHGYDRSGTLIDIFNGILSGNVIAGTFTRQKDLKKMPFQLTR